MPSYLGEIRVYLANKPEGRDRVDAGLAGIVAGRRERQEAIGRINGEAFLTGPYGVDVLDRDGQPAKVIKRGEEWYMIKDGKETRLDGPLWAEAFRGAFVG